MLLSKFLGDGVYHKNEDRGKRPGKFGNSESRIDKLCMSLFADRRIIPHFPHCLLFSKINFLKLNIHSTDCSTLLATCILERKSTGRLHGKSPDEGTYLLFFQAGSESEFVCSPFEIFGFFSSTQPTLKQKSSFGKMSIHFYQKSSV
jgi:hypothetical protein